MRQGLLIISLVVKSHKTAVQWRFYVHIWIRDEVGFCNYYKNPQLAMSIFFLTFSKVSILVLFSTLTIRGCVYYTRICSVTMTMFQGRLTTYSPSSLCRLVSRLVTMTRQYCYCYVSDRNNFLLGENNSTTKQVQYNTFVHSGQ